MFCSYCGAKLEDGASYCSNCGAPVESVNRENINQTSYNNGGVYQESKSKITTGLLAIFLGSFGVHNFYLGYTGKAIAQLLLTTIGSFIIIGPVISSIWSLVEGIVYLVSNDKTDARGVPLI